MILDGDEAARGALTRLIAEMGHAPSLEQLADELKERADDVAARLQRLADAHCLLLHPHSTRPWVVHPFALAPGSCWVRTARHGYWANCLYCAFGIAAALNSDATITTRYGGEDHTVVYDVKNGVVEPNDDVFHLSTPVAQWWDNVVFACSTFQPFRRESDIDPWCRAHDLPRGAVLSIPQLWSFARDWYGAYIDKPWRKRSASDVCAIFERNGLTGAFWSVSG
jgi:hypothetical protein